MRKIIVSAAAAVMALAAPAFAVTMPQEPASVQAGLVEQATHYYGHKPKCFYKKIRKHDYYGNVVIRKVKVCR